MGTIRAPAAEDKMGSTPDTAMQLMIGWATADITPAKPTQLQGQFHERISQYVRDPLTVTALALEGVGEDGDTEQAIMVSIDVADVPWVVLEELRTQVGAHLPGFDTGKLFLNSTHTHTSLLLMEDVYFAPPPPGVMTPAENRALLVRQATDAAVRAWKTRKPGGVSWALGHAAVGFCRRLVYEDGSAVMYGSSDTPRFRAVEGIQDHSVEILFCWDEADHLTGVVANVACPSQVAEVQYYISADFWAAVRAELRKRFHEDLFVYPMTGAAGDQSPRDLVRRGRGEPNMRDESGLEEMGRRIANAVEYAYHTAQSDVHREVVFVHHAEDLDLPMRKATRAEMEDARKLYDKLAPQQPDPSSREAMQLRRAKTTMERFEQQGEDPRYSYDLHVIRLGDIAIATNPFELFLDYGLRMKAQSKATQTFVVQLAGDIGPNYLPTTKAVAGGGYGAMVIDNKVGPEGGEILVDRTVELINGMWGDEAK
jgi:hypothetical protein